MNFLQLLSFKLLFIVTVVMVSSLETSHPNGLEDTQHLQRIARSPPLSLLDEENNSERSDSKPGMWFGPRLGRSLQRSQLFDTLAWISLDDSLKLPSKEQLQLLGMGKNLGYNTLPWSRRPEQKKVTGITFVYPRERRVSRTPEGNANAAMWFGPRVGRSLQEYDVADEDAFNYFNEDDVQTPSKMYNTKKYLQKEE